jgi:vanadium chloroperoxidase
VNNPANAALKKYGEDAANGILAARAGDPGAGGFYKFLPVRPNHQPDPLRPGAGHPRARLRQRDAVRDGEHPTLIAPPYGNGGAPAYVKAYNQVHDRGGARFQNTTTRTPEQTAIGYFWRTTGCINLGTPPRLYNQVVSTAVRPLNLTSDELMELFAHVNVAMGDAGIFAWREKYKWNFWRPVVGIRHHDPSTGPDAVGGQLPGGNTPPAPVADPFWVYLGAPSTNTPHPPFTPPFPAYPSGHATFGAAAFRRRGWR